MVGLRLMSPMPLLSCSSPSKIMKRTLLHRLVVFAALALAAQSAWAADALTFFNNWFVTGDYAVAGVGLRGTGVNGWATGTINMSGIPANAEPIAAFLYWSTSETNTTPSARVGYFNGHQIQAVVLENPLSPNPPCWSSGGTTGATGTAAPSYRADVLRYLPVNSNNIRQANGAHTVKLPDSGGSGNGNVLYTNGATLVVIYRIVVPGNPAAVPLRSIVIYDGAFTMDNHSAGMTQNIAGFYQASANPSARITNLVANGQPGMSSPLSFNGTNAGTTPFLGSLGPRWDSPTSQVSLNPGAASFSTMATVGNNQTCLTWAAIVASVNVQDTDSDGLLDVWETQGLHRNTQVSPATFGTCTDYPRESCVNLPAMGANPNRKDIFVQIDWMHGTGDGTGGINGSGAHDHIPKLDALSAVAGSFSNQGIQLHFDVGSNYQAGCNNAPCNFIVPAAYAQGGSDLDETSLVCRDTAAHTCDYHQPFPVLSFEFGFASVKDGNHLMNVPSHFTQNRKDIFHYALFAHALGGPFDLNGHPVDPNTGQPSAVPKSYSGLAHRPGGGFMVTLGLWRSDISANDQVGSVQVQAGTLMHELGHNLGLSHAGLSTKPNCMPDYPSVMNYLYQTRGLTDGAGVEHVDYSYGNLLGLNENSLSLATSLGPAQRYRTRYYGPLGPASPSGAVSQLHCDGTAITNGAIMARSESPNVGSTDWGNGTVNWNNVASIPSDINFDGITGENFTDQPDWTSLNLQQIGTGYSFGGLSVGAQSSNGGVFASDGGVFASDAGSLAAEAGVFASDGGVFASDGGAFASDGGVFASDGGVFASDGGAFASDAGDLDFSTVILSSVDAPPPPSPSCPTCGLIATASLTAVGLTWTPPDTGNIPSYNLYRCAVIAPAITCTPSGSAFKNVAGLTPTPHYTDAVNDFVDSGAPCSTATCYNTPYIYSATSLVSGVESGFSNTATGIVKHLFIKADDLSRVYGAANPTLTFTTTGLDPGGLTGTTTCTTTATQSSPPGPYTITCSGLTPAAGVTYSPGTLTIKKADATIVVTSYSLTYDATAHTASGKATGINGEDLTASLNLTGTTHTNAGDYPNDTWTFTGGTYYNDATGTVHDNIAKAHAVIAITPYSVTYDTLAHTATGTATGVKSADLSAGLNLGGTTHTNAGDYPTDGWSFSGAPNYYDASGTVHDKIAQATATIVVTPYSVIYDGKSHTATGKATGINNADLSAGLNLTGTTHTNVGTYNNDPWTFADPNNNYNSASGSVNDAILWSFTVSPLKTPATLGSAVPISWTLQDASGNFISAMNTLVRMDSVFNGAAPRSGCVASLVGAPQTLYSLPNGSTGNSSFRYGSSYQFNWDTTTAAATGRGCYTVKITLNDGSVRLTNPVQLK